MEELTSEWVAKAENDFYTADLALHAGEFPIPDTACFHCQQCAEKYLKAFLQEHGVQFLPRHNLMPLLDLCVSLDRDFEGLRGNMRQLESYSVAVRYPGMDVSIEIAERSFQQARQTRQFVREKLLHK
ncbi:MAG: HEPN domain-containing protein [Anaerolineaceae bacterium]|nr:MAG: HEPN domain-containing protein [Anaerolineaceae bacterium]